MVLDKYDQLAYMEVWNPRWHDRRALLACYKVDKARTDHIKVVFPKSKAMDGDWYMSRKMARGYPKETNGTIDCYAVPLDKFEVLEIAAQSILDLK